jgi:hypothetical protein
VHLDPAQRSIMGEFITPEVTAIDIDALLGQIRSVMDNAALAITTCSPSRCWLVSRVTAAIQSTRDERR